MRVLVAGGGTGGHLYPGLAIARALVRLSPRVQPYFVGARRGIEREVLPTTEFAHTLLDLHPLYRARPWENWKTVRGLAGAWRNIGALVGAERPRAVIATGGYAAGAMLAYAATHGLMSVLQESNSYPGLTMRAFSRFAREIYLGFPEAAERLPRGRHTAIVDTGNPIEPPPAARPNRAMARGAWGLPTSGHVLLIVGGSQGARAVNEAVSEWLDAGLPDGLHVIWSTGKTHFDRYRRHDGERVKVRAFLSPIADAYAATDLALVRAGAMTTAELCAWGIPMVLVPLPTAAADHQTANAVALERAGAAVHLPQAELTVERLRTVLRDLLASPEALMRLATAALRRGKPAAAETIARRVLTLIELTPSQS